MMQTARILPIVIALALLSGCGAIELVASGISDGTKYVMNRAEEGQQGQQPGQTAPQAASPAPAAPAARQDPAAAPVSAAPVTRVGRPEPLQ